MASDAEGVINRDGAGGHEKRTVTFPNDWHSSRVPGDTMTRSASTPLFSEVDENSQTSGRIYRRRSKSRTGSRSFVGRYRDRRLNAQLFGFFRKYLVVTLGLFLVTAVSVRLLICLKKEASSAFRARSRRGEPLWKGWRATGSSVVRRLGENAGHQVALLDGESPPPYEQRWDSTHGLPVPGFSEIPLPPYAVEDPNPPPSYDESCDAGGGLESGGSGREAGQLSRAVWRRALIANLVYVALTLIAAVVLTVMYGSTPADARATGRQRAPNLGVAFVPWLFGLLFLLVLLHRRPP